MSAGRPRGRGGEGRRPLVHNGRCVINRGRAAMRRRILLAAVLTTCIAVAGFAITTTPAAASPAVQYRNPLVAQRADAHIYRHTDGYSYFTATVPEYDRIILRRATTVQGLASAPETVIWRRHSSGDMAAHIWAPEIHFINNKWYVYFAAG